MHNYLYVVHTEIISCRIIDTSRSLRKRKTNFNIFWLYLYFSLLIILSTKLCLKRRWKLKPGTIRVTPVFEGVKLKSKKLKKLIVYLRSALLQFLPLYVLFFILIKPFYLQANITSI